MALLDKPEQTARLVKALQAAVPFAVSPTPEIIVSLAEGEEPMALATTETVFDISYLGDPGGIMCHIRLGENGRLVVISLTHVRVARTLPFARAVIDYQRHRSKKIRKQSNSAELDFD